MFRIALPYISVLPAFLKLYKQRYLCNDPGHSFTTRTQIVEKHCHISTQTHQWSAHQCNQRLTEKYIAEIVSVSITTMQQAIEHTAHAICQLPTHDLPEHLCFDEFRSVKSVDTAMSFIFCKAMSHQVKTITIDMYLPYINIIKVCFSNAKIIIDKFHLVQTLNRELNRTRIHVIHQYQHQNRPLYNKFKRYWKLILKQPSYLTRTEYKKFR